MNKLISELRTNFLYNPETGVFTNINQRQRCYNDSVAGYIKEGYIVLTYKGKKYLAHRLAYAFMTGEFPPEGYEVDHIDGNTTNNTWSNLRLATHSQNMHNSKLRANNSSGYKGVTWHKHANKWIAQIQVNGNQIYLGSFNSAEEANSAVMQARVKLHQEFTNHG